MWKDGREEGREGGREEGGEEEYKDSLEDDRIQGSLCSSSIILDNVLTLSLS